MCNHRSSSSDWVRRILRPLVDVLVHRGINFTQLSLVLKRLYFEVAVAQTETAGARPNDSRLSVVTGLQRRDIKALRDTPAEAARQTTVSHPARAVALWLTDARFAGRDTLPRRSDTGASFEALARAVSQDMHPRSILDALVSAGTVTVDDEGDVTLVSRAYLPHGDNDAALGYFTANVGDHARAAGQNLMADKVTHFERAVHYNCLTEAGIAELQGLSAGLFQDALEVVNARAAVLQKQALEGGVGKMRFRAGGYCYNGKEEVEE